MRELSRELGRMWPLPLEGEDKIEITFEGEEMEGLKTLALEHFQTALTQLTQSRDIK